MHPLVFVFRHLSWRDRAIASQVSKEWHRAGQDPEVWRTLDLSGQQNALPALRMLPKAPPLTKHLRCVNLEFTAGVEDEHLQYLECAALEDVNLNACQRLSEAAISRLVRKLPKIRSLSLYWNLNVHDGLLISLAAYNTRLQQLSLSGCRHITNDGLRTLAGCCTSLTHLDLTRCLNISERAYVFLAQQCKKLQELRLYANEGLTDTCLEAFSKLQQLRLIDVCGANRITDAGLAALANCHQLGYVNLSWCVKITDQGIITLAACCPGLELLSLHGILGISDKSLEALAENCRRLGTLDVHGCINVQRRGWAELRRMFPRLHTTVVHK